MKAVRQRRRRVRSARKVAASSVRSDNTRTAVPGRWKVEVEFVPFESEEARDGAYKGWVGVVVGKG